MMKHLLPDLSHVFSTCSHRVAASLAVAAKAFGHLSGLRIVVSLKTVLALSAALLPLVATNLTAATYYIDYSAGIDSNSGTSKTSPWKRHPRMSGFSGSYVHVSGDKFIFKGGVVWPTSCFQMYVTDSGTSSSLDYYGVDASWYAGTSFNRPAFDFQNTSIGGWGVSNSGIRIGGSWQVWDRLEFKRHRSDANYGSSTISCYGADKVTFQDCAVYDWDLATPIASGSGNGGGGIANFYDQGGGGITVIRCVLHQVGSATKNGSALFQIPNCYSNEVYSTATAYHGGGTISWNRFHDLIDNTDPAAHQDCIITFSPSDVIGNLIYNLTGRAAPIELGPGYSASSGTSRVFNNVVWNCGDQTPCWLKCDKSSYPNHTLQIYNNTFEHGNAICVMIEVGGAGINLGTLDCRNNHFITTATPVRYNDPSAGFANVNNAIVSNNLTQSGSIAASSGYAPSNNYAPTSGSSPTVGRGVDLTGSVTSDRLGNARFLPMDLGAYQWNGAAVTTPPSVNIASPISGATVSGSVSVSASASTGSSGATVSSVQFTVDGNAIGTGAASGGAFAISWDSRTVADGTHSISAVAQDSSGGVSSRVSVSVNVSNGNNNSTAGSSNGGLLTGLSWAANAGNLSSPFTVITSSSVSYVTQDSATGPTDGGKAVYSFDVPSAGTYSVSGVVSTTDQDHNSFYITFETDPSATEANVWDLPVTGGSWQTTYASWRGTGSNVSPQFPLKTWNLAAGPHQLTIVGREPQSMLKQVSVVKIPTPPANLRIVSQ